LATTVCAYAVAGGVEDRVEQKLPAIDMSTLLATVLFTFNIIYE